MATRPESKTPASQPSVEIADGTSSDRHLASAPSLSTLPSEFDTLEAAAQPSAPSLWPVWMATHGDHPNPVIGTDPGIWAWRSPEGPAPQPTWNSAPQPRPEPAHSSAGPAAQEPPVSAGPTGPGSVPNGTDDRTDGGTSGGTKGGTHEGNHPGDPGHPPATPSGEPVPQPDDPPTIEIDIDPLPSGTPPLGPPDGFEPHVTPLSAFEPTGGTVPEPGSLPLILLAGAAWMARCLASGRSRR
jgi:hypothetical protein